MSAEIEPIRWVYVTGFCRPARVHFRFWVLSCLRLYTGTVEVVSFGRLSSTAYGATFDRWCDNGKLGGAK